MAKYSISDLDEFLPEESEVNQAMEEWQQEEEEEEEEEESEHTESEAEEAEEEAKHEDQEGKSKSHEDGAIKRLAKRKLGDSYKVVELYAKEWKFSMLDIAAFLFYTLAFNRAKRVRKEVIFDQPQVMNAYHWSQYAFAAYGGPKWKDLHERLPFLEEEDFIAGNWDKAELENAPAWFIALDHDTKSIVVALRGTKGKEDILVDLNCMHVPWLGGYAHEGFIKSLDRLLPFIEPIVKAQVKKYPDYSIKITGHSMGAAVSSLLTLHWVHEHPDWNIYGYGFATPCVMSAHLLEESRKYFDTYVNHYDAVSRLSMGSIEDVRQGMTLFLEKAGKNHSRKIFLQAMGKAANIKSAQKALQVAGAIENMLQSSIEREVSSLSDPVHLLPAGNVYQLWREDRGKKFQTWEMFKGESSHYGRLQFAKTMLADHGSAGYRAAFENILAISVVERSLWLRMTPTQRSIIHDYWNSFPEADPYQKGYDVSYAVEAMKRSSKYKKKAMRAGMIRPFLLLVSMAPKHRAALADMLGIRIVFKGWYQEFDPHHEAWVMLKARAKGVQSRSNSAGRSMNPLAHQSNWWMVLHTCEKAVRKSQSKYIDPQIKSMLKGHKRSYGGSIQACMSSEGKELPKYEELVMLMFYNLVESQVPDNPTEFSADEIQKVKDDFIELGFTTPRFLDVVARQILEHSTTKKANEVYAWGDIVRREDERINKRTIAAVGGLGLLGGALFLSAIPMVVAAPPVALIPLAIGAGVGAAAVAKATPGGLVAIVVGCLQQRLALAVHGEKIEDYYA